MHKRVLAVATVLMAVVGVAFADMETDTGSFRAGGGVMGRDGSNATAFNTTAAPAASGTFSGVTGVLSTVRVDVTAASATAQENAAVFRITSGVGAANPATAAKEALGTETICNTGSAGCWGVGHVLSMSAGYVPTTRNSLVAELDVNNNAADCANGDPSVLGYHCGFILLTGAGSKNITYGITISGNAKILQGIVEPASGGPSSDFIKGYGTATNFLIDVGSRGNGLYAGTATYSGNFIVGPGGHFIVSPTGAVTSDVQGSLIGGAGAGYGLEVLGGTSSDQLRIGTGATTYFKLGRNGATGNLDFVSDGSFSAGYKFDGALAATSFNKWVFTAPTTAATFTAGGDNLTYTFPAASKTLMASDYSNGSGPTPVACGGTCTLGAANRGGYTRLDTAAGSVATLPGATGTGNVYKLYVSVITTSAADKVLTNPTSDTIIGTAIGENAGTAKVFVGNAGTFHSIQMPFTGSQPSGGFVGDTITCTDVASAIWKCDINYQAGTTPTTPYSAATT